MIAVLRHGAERGADPGGVASRSAGGLSADGRAQAAAAARFLAPLGEPEVWSSPAPRALETARIVAGDRPVRVHRDLRGMELGDWEGRARAADLAEALTPAAGRAPGGESLADLGERAGRALAEAAAADGDVVMVGHRMANAAMLGAALGLPPELAWLAQQSPGAVSALLADGPGRPRPGLLNVTPADPLRLGARRVGVVAGERAVERRLYLVRHGEADMITPDGRMRSHAPVGLTARGRAQAKALARRFRPLRLARVHASDLARALETARVLGAGAPVRRWPDLREISLGRLEGAPAADALAAEPRFLVDPDAALDGGESVAAVAARAVPALGRLLDEDGGGDVVVVAHGAVNRALVGALLGLPLRDALRLRQDWACVNVLERAGGRWWAGALNWTPLGLGELRLTRPAGRVDEDIWRRLGR